jgi:DNA-binding response OmpR family regulator
MSSISFVTLYREDRVLPWNVLVVPCHFLIDFPRLDFSQPLLACGPAVMALACYESGADDFMRDGWSLPELEARLHHLLVPELPFLQGRLRLRGSTLSLEFPEGLHASIQLDVAEMSMMERLMRKPNRIVPFDLLDGPELASMEAAEAASRRGKSLAMRILRLKARLASLDPRLPDSIQSARGFGYMWKTC